MKVIGITGTNGKTTTTHIVCEILQKAGYKTAKIGTITNRLTTPSPWELAEIFEQERRRGTEYLVMEVSSHGIHQDRVKGIFFHVKALTNITRDHLDYHKTFRAYKKVKYGWLKRGCGIKITPRDWRREKIDFTHPFIGKFNEHNMQTALAVLKSLNILPEKKLKKLFAGLSPIPGRFEVIQQNPGVIVDYAHTPDGLENLLNAVSDLRQKQKSRGRLITVFGCGGDRDKGKRPKMGRLALRKSDICLVTSDNPRTEKPEAIIQDILAGMHQGFFSRRKKIIVQADRRQAIQQAVRLAQAEDLVVLAGKGHETYQVLGRKKQHFDDREEAKKALKKCRQK
ncbi:MAG: UDP-N-acetylmuramoyl-L-alanyl-D-glutamate--2,6-diaminopimelate ligase [Candidatus Margulisbacteria bacterium]|jgi:UDP-N-acetylmuramoyl-L-alanyl-D-glutamate--2,6-diaminopimelate ligase|nr:UDP-N-acetylmuramoyl-L-alanyl-D-glutamate--2,6-diaminopimelate ligase [Candidatus Margulisiibacteriota bacterium]